MKMGSLLLVTLPAWVTFACGSAQTPPAAPAVPSAGEVPAADEEHRPPPGGGHAGPADHGPPAEAIAACTGKQTGDACTVSIGGESHTGTCAAHRTDAIACRPEGGPGGPGRPDGPGGPGRPDGPGAPGAPPH